MIYQLLYNLVSNRHLQRADKRTSDAAAARVFDRDVEPLAEYKVDAYESPPLSIQSLVRVQQLKEIPEPARDRAQPLEDQSVTESTPLSQRLKNSLLVRGMPASARALLEDARREEAGQRTRDRIPFIHPVIIELAEDGRRIAGLTRDISALGIGLVHGTEIAPQIVRVEAHDSNDKLIRLEVDILWSVSCGAGWHFSGGLFR